MFLGVFRRFFASTLLKLKLLSLVQNKIDTLILIGDATGINPPYLLLSQRLGKIYPNYTVSVLK